MRLAYAFQTNVFFDCKMGSKKGYMEMSENFYLEILIWSQVPPYHYIYIYIYIYVLYVFVCMYILLVFKKFCFNLVSSGLLQVLHLIVLQES